MAYFANSTEGGILDAQCQDCPLGWGWNDPNQKQLFEVEQTPRPCPTALVQLLYNYEQLKEGNKDLQEAMNILVDEAGTCMTRQELLEIRREQSNGS